MSTPSKNLPLFSESLNSSSCDPFYYEEQARGAGYALIAGVDEVGRGPLAGPVVACAVILPAGATLAGIKDSKTMTVQAREKAFPAIHAQAMAVGIGVVSHGFIDKFNILRASLEAMKCAVMGLEPKPEFLLVDGIHKIPISIPQRCLKKGDRISRSISAASVVAKVYRDRIMCSYHRSFPVYGFDRNKGYGTQHHREALHRYGPCPLHRLTFNGVFGIDERKT